MHAFCQHAHTQHQHHVHVCYEAVHPMLPNIHCTVQPNMHTMHIKTHGNPPNMKCFAPRHKHCSTHVGHRNAFYGTDGRQQLLDCQEAQQQLQQQLRASQHDASCLQSSLDVATAAKQEAEALCLQLHEEVGRLQSQVAGMTHSVSLCQSQQLELQASLS